MPFNCFPTSEKLIRPVIPCVDFCREANHVVDAFAFTIGKACSNKILTSQEVQELGLQEKKLGL